MGIAVCLIHFGQHQAGAHGADIDVSVPQFFAQTKAKGRYVRFRCAVDDQIRVGDECRSGGYFQNRAAIHDIGQTDPGNSGGADAVQVDDAQHFVQLHRFKRRTAGDAGIVDENFDLRLLLLQLFCKDVIAAAVGKVQRQNDTAFVGVMLGDFAQPFLTPRNQPKFLNFWKNLCDCIHVTPAKPGGCTCNDCCVHEKLLFLLS